MLSIAFFFTRFLILLLLLVVVIFYRSITVRLRYDIVYPLCLLFYFLFHIHRLFVDKCTSTESLSLSLCFMYITKTEFVHCKYCAYAELNGCPYVRASVPWQIMM